MRTTLFGILFALSIALLPLTPLYAADPVVTSFVANPSSVNNAYPVTFTWSQTSGAGGTISFTNCAVGLTIKNASGSDVCSSSVSESSANGSDYVTVYNVSGSSKSFTATYTAKDDGGVAVSSATMSATVSVSAVPVPITGFSVANPTIASGGTQTFTWTGVYIPGANLQFDCNPDVTISSGGTDLACGTPAFSSDLAGSGSQSVTVTNKGRSDTVVTARVLPAMAANAYDAVHSQQTAFVVSAPVAPVGAGNPSVSSFTTSKTNITSGSTVDLGWVTANSSGANMIFNCDSSITISTQVAGATTTLVCGSTAFTQALPVTGTSTLTIVSSRLYPQTIGMVLMPQNTGGTYFSQYAKTLSISVAPPGSTASPSALATTPVYTLIAGTNGSSATGTMHLPLTRALYKGLTHSQVSILQQFLAQDTAIYPLGLVTGYFGSATEVAVQKFQLKYGLSKVGDSAYGFVGPMTRSKINSLVTP